jgi:hypothetical protein
MLKLGKRPARHAIAFRFGDFFDLKKLPAPPAVFGHWQAVDNFHMLANDQYGDCVFAGAAHEHMVWSLEGGKPRARFTIHDVLSDYAAVTGFDPAKPATDQGTDMEEAASYRRKTGVLDATGARHRIDAYVALKIGDVDQLAFASWMFGACGVGLQLPQQAMAAFDKGELWDVPPRPQIAGGHYVPCVGRDACGHFLVVTWGEVQAMTPAFYERFCDEACAYLSLEVLNEKKLSPEGFDETALRAALNSLSH